MSVADLQRAITLLESDGFTVVGPTVQGDAIVTDRIRSVTELPRGVGDEQSPGRYRLRRRADDALFSWAVPATPLKRELFAPRTTLVQIRLGPGRPAVSSPKRSYTKIAFVGARPCELAAVLVQDRVLAGAHADPDYIARRAGAFFFVVSCGEPAGTCFCASMGTGPRAESDFDLAATEVTTEANPESAHFFIVEAGSAAGAALLARLGLPSATDEEVGAARAVTERAASRMGRTLDAASARQALATRPDHPRFADVAERCLGCANCTMACPTCFCATIEDTTDLSGEVATRDRLWDSCFDVEYAYIHGGSVRPSLAARYRQWITHKLSTWHEQFGTSGCVGCGRCITWCPVGIDITEEARAVAATR